MAEKIEISDDDDSFGGPGCSKTAGIDTMDDVVAISSDEEFNNMSTDTVLLSEDEEYPEVILKKNTAIKTLFPSKNKPSSVTKHEDKKVPVKALFPQKQNVNVTVTKPIKMRPPIEAPKEVFKRMIEGVNVMLPVNPYGSQVALMSKVNIRYNYLILNLSTFKEKCRHYSIPYVSNMKDRVTKIFYLYTCFSPFY